MILVTGGAGFIGSHLVEALAAVGEEVVVIDNFVSGDPSNLQENIEVVEADIADPETVDLVTELHAETIVHAAGQVSVAVSMTDPRRDLEANVGGTANVLAGARASGAERFVFLSTGAGIYGESDGADEGALPRPLSYYSMHKYLAERYVEISGVPYAIARLANVYGPRQRADSEGGVVAVFAERLRNGFPIAINGTGEQSRDFVYVTDVVDALLVMLRSKREGTWNVATAQSTNLLELLRLLEKVIAPATKVQHGPARPGDVKNSCLSIDKIQEELGWRPKYDLGAGIANAV